MSIIVSEYQGSRYPVPQQAPQQQMVELYTPIRAWHNGQFKLATLAHPITVDEVRAGSNILTLMGTEAGLVVSIIASSPWIALGTAAFFAYKTLANRGLTIDPEDNIFKERSLMLINLQQIDDPIAIERTPFPGSNEILKTYDFANGQLASAWASNQGAAYWRNSFEIIVRDSNGQVKEIASMPELRNNHRPLFDCS